VIELRHLAHALALAEHRNFARAAKALHMSQPALTRNIQMLEERMGLPLFERMRSGVEPTDAGQLLLKRAKSILGQADDLMREVGGVGTGAEMGLRVAVGPYPAGLIVAPAVASMLGKWPDLKFDIIVDHWVDAIRKLRDRRVEFAICEGSEVRNGDLESLPLVRHKVHPVVRKGHPLLDAKNLTFKEIMKWPLAVSARLPPRVLSKVVPASQLKGGFDPAVHCEDNGLLKTLVQESDLVAFFTLSMVEDELISGRMVALEVDEPWLTTGFALFHLKDRTLSRVAVEFIREIQLADEQAAARDQELARTFARRPSQTAKGRKTATSKAK
jgi:DNA-binding transcriptional LysR family regulator